MTPPMFSNYFETGIGSCPQTYQGRAVVEVVLVPVYLVLRFLLSLEWEDEMRRDKIDNRDKEMTFEPIFLRTRSCQ